MLQSAEVKAEDEVHVCVWPRIQCVVCSNPPTVFRFITKHSDNFHTVFRALET